MAVTVFVVQRNIESLEEIVDEVPAKTTEIICLGKGLRSLKGIENLSSVKDLYVSYNQITSLEELCRSNVTGLNISGNQITSLEDLVGSNVTGLIIFDNPCFQQFQDQFGGSIENVKEYYSQFLDTPKDPGFE